MTVFTSNIEIRFKKFDILMPIAVLVRGEIEVSLPGLRHSIILFARNNVQIKLPILAGK